MFCLAILLGILLDILLGILLGFSLGILAVILLVILPGNSAAVGSQCWLLRAAAMPSYMPQSTVPGRGRRPQAVLRDGVHGEGLLLGTFFFRFSFFFLVWGEGFSATLANVKGAGRLC